MEVWLLKWTYWLVDTVERPNVSTTNYDLKKG